MCEKKPYDGRRIDPCIQHEIDHINDWNCGKFTTLLSCCGHGRYPKTIVVKNNYSQGAFEWFSGTQLPLTYKNGKPRERYYTKDGDDHYYIKEVIETLGLEVV